jgi:hypothetical protein
MCGVLFIKSKKIWGTLLVIFLAILFFGFTSHKSALISSILLMGLYYFLKFEDSLTKLLLGFFILIFISTVALYFYEIYNNHAALMFGSIIFRRGLILPSEINYAYYDYFSNGNYIYWANSKLSLELMAYNYDKALPQLIGDFMFPEHGASANTGFLGSGYAQAGFTGLFIYALIISIFLKYADSAIASLNDKNLGMAVLVIPSLVLMTSSDLGITFLSHGLIFSLFIVSIMQKKKNAY